MNKTITIDPVTRIEGHSKITIHLDEDDEVTEARLHITQFRGFEKFCEGRPFSEMPSLMARICGICPVSHLIASAKACDMLLAVEVPENAARLRRILNLAQIVQSHALSFFHLSAPDLVLGMDAPPETRNVFGLMQSHPQLARDGIALRKFGQEIIALLGGKRIHPSWVVPGGVSEALTADRRDEILAAVPGALDIARRTLDWFWPTLQKFADEISVFGQFPSLFMGLVTHDAGLEHYDGLLRITNASGKPLSSDVDPTTFPEIIGEAVEPWSYLKFP
jgi:NAD-reducing hydrogenase large subunit